MFTAAAPLFARLASMVIHLSVGYGSVPWIKCGVAAAAIMRFLNSTLPTSRGDSSFS
jgi:hypothetical protein